MRRLECRAPSTKCQTHFLVHTHHLGIEREALSLALLPGAAPSLRTATRPSATDAVAVCTSCSEPPEPYSLFIGRVSSPGVSGNSM